MKTRSDKPAPIAPSVLPDGPNIKPRDWKEEADRMLREYLYTIQNQFYLTDRRLFFKHRYMHVQAITWPQRIMVKMGVFLPFATQRRILDNIISDIKRKGTDAIDHFGGYFLHCVQTHIKLRQDLYYNEAKAAAAKPVAGMPLEAILQGVRIEDRAMTEARAAEYQLEIANTFKPKRRQKKAPEPPKKADNQLDLGL
jgi:hypothetical protein